MPRIQRFHTRLLLDDLTVKGWQAADLALRAGVAKSSVSRFISGEHQTSRMAKKLALALGYSVRRYLIRSQEAA